MRRRITLIGMLAALVVLVPVAAIAAYPFTDGPYGVHDADVDWLYNAGVTQGCTATEYCPSDPVTRAQMASFMHRLSGNVPGIDPSVQAKPQATIDVATSTSTSIYSGGAWDDVGGATAQIEVPAGQVATILARFTAESRCYNGSGSCSVRVLVDGTEAAPAAGLNFAFDSTDDNTETSLSPESHSVERVAQVGPGTHTVTVEAATVGGSTLLLDDWTLVADARLSTP